MAHPLDIHPDPGSGLAFDISDARAAVADSQRTAEAIMAGCIAAAQGPRCAGAWVSTDFEGALQTAAAVDAACRAGATLPPLAGLAVSIKDLFDVRGQTTAAGSRVLASTPAASADAAAVARLRNAGAVFIGRTNMSEFAFSGVGINPHYGTPTNAAAWSAQGPARVPGGSTSGGATSVAAGAAFAALGSDTGGSIRIPAALQGLVGFKNTARLTPLAGAVPLSSTLDTVCAITRSVRDAALLHAILSGQPTQTVLRPQHAISAMRLGVPRRVMLDGLEAPVAEAFERSIKLMRDAGADIVEVEAPELAELASINAQGGFAAAESWAWHRALLKDRSADYDPRVSARIRRGEHMLAADYIDLMHARADWILRMQRQFAGFDAWLSPTVPCVAPLLAPLLESDDAFFATNARLLRNPSAVNFLDGCALSLPCHEPGALPVGLMVWGPALTDDRVLGVSLIIESCLAQSL